MPQSKPKVLIILGPLFREEEVIYPYYRLKEAGYEVLIAGIGESRYTGKFGFDMKADVQIEQCDSKEYAAVVIPGGFAPDKIRMNDAALKFVRQMHENKKIVAAICHGGWVPISAGIIKGKRVTGYRAIRDDLVNAGGIFEDKSVVVDGNLITSRQPSDLPDFCRELLKTLS